MLKAIKELGECIRKKEKSDTISTLIELPKLKGTKKIICVVIEKRDNGFVFSDVYVEDFDLEKAKKILYRTHRHGRYDVTLTTKCNKPEKLKERWRLWFENTRKEYPDNYSSFFERMRSTVLADTVIQKIYEKYNSLGKEDRKNCIVTVKIKEGDREKYLGEIPEFVEIFERISVDKFYRKHKTESKGYGVCCLCLKSGEVFPASPFSVFTVDKVGFAYEFNRENAWKQLPICLDCSFDLEEGKKFLMDRLSFKVYQYQYFVIPYAVQQETLSEVINEIEHRKSHDYRRGLIDAEEDIMEIMKEKEDVITMILIFYKTKGGKKDYFDILRYVEEIPPSWIKRIYDTFDRISQKSIFREDSLKVILGEKWAGDFRWGSWDGRSIEDMHLAGIVKEFFYIRNETGKNLSKAGLNILGDIFGRVPIDRDFLVRHLIGAIREEHEKGNEWSERMLTIKSFYLLEFLLEVGLVSGSKEVCSVGEEIKGKIGEFFSEHSNAFDTPEKKAVFLEGVLTRFLLDVQYMKRKETPFRKKLHGLKLNKKLIKRLFSEVIEKLEQYGVSYPSLQSLVAEYFVKADENGWEISDEEVSYYFALGLNLGRKFKGGDLNE